MPTPTYDLLATTTLSTAAASVEFSGLSSSYRDFVIAMVATPTGGTESWAKLQVGNGTINTSNLFTWVNMIGSSSGVQTFPSPSAQNYVEIALMNKSGANQINGFVNIMDATTTDKHKTFIIRGNDSGILTSAHAARWANTSAINIVKIYTDVTTFTAGSTFSVYGLVS